MNKKLAVVVSLCASIYSGALFANSDEISSQLENVIKAENIAMSKDSESIEGILKNMHSESPASMHIKTTFEGRFSAADVNLSLEEFGFVGMDGGYAIARIKRKVEKVSGPASLKSHVIERIYTFKQEQGQWKIWQAVMLDKEYL